MQLLPLSAATAAGVAARAATLGKWLAQHRQHDLADVAFTLQVGRRSFPWRSFALATDAKTARATLAATESAPTARIPADPPPVVFMFSGQGSQHPQMAASLYRNEPAFRASFDTCADLLRPVLGQDVRQLLYPPDAEAEKEAAAALQRTALAQPVLFAIEYALLKLWEHWGVRPTALIGHSLGEYLGACAAGVIDLEAALELVCARGQLMQSAPPGAMMAVPLSAALLQPRLHEMVEIAAINAPESCVVGGPPPAVAAFASHLRLQGIEPQTLNVSHAFHSAAMEPILLDFAAAMRRYRLQPPHIPYVSNLSGDWIRPEQATDPDYYVRHLRRPVRFADGLQRVLRDYPDAILLEVGPGQALTQAARRCAPGATVLPSLPSPRSGMTDQKVLFSTVGQLWSRGIEIDWAAFAEPDRRKVGLPGYPFQRQRHWIEPPDAAVDAPRDSAAKSATDSSLPASSERRVYLPGWQPQPLPAMPHLEGHWLLLSNGSDDAGMARVLRAAGCRVSRVECGERWARSRSRRIYGAAARTR